MSSWLLGIAGVVIIGVLIELLLTDSPMSKFIRSIYAFFILFVIVQPLPSFLKNAAETVNSGGGIELNTELLKTINTQAAAALARNCQNALEIAGFENVLITIDIDKTSSNFQIKNVYCNAYDVVLRSSNTALDIKKEIKKIVSAICSVAEDKILVSTQE